MTVWMNIVTPEYFARMHIGFIGGRTFDDEGGGVIINEELAKRVGLGEKMKIGGKTVEVIGVVKTAKYMRWDEAPRPFFYLPYAQNYASRMTLHVESSQDIFAAVRSLAREIPGSDARMLRDYFDQGAMFGVRAALRIAGIAGGAGLLLALAGLYGMVASSVARRRREIGIRVALGARHATIFRMIAGQGMTIAPIGIGLGLAAAHYGSQWLPAPATSSGWASAGAAGLILAASFVACAAPAIRALRLDPAVVLRED
jgi:putative ABC transport system permease protein